MSNLDSFAFFPLLALELRLTIWELTLNPRLISLMPQAYGDSSAIPCWKMDGYLSPDPGIYVTRGIYSARFTPSYDDLSHASLQVSRESRQLALSRGYRVWKMQDRQGRTRDVMWNPTVDVILFPADPTTSSRFKQLAVRPYHWLRLFAAQHPEEAKIVNNIAIHTSLFPRRIFLPIWLLEQLAKFPSMRKLIVVVDKEYERYQVLKGIQNNEDESWNIPQDIEGAIRIWKQRQPESQLTIPDVRVVENVDGILTRQSLPTYLMVRPLEFLGIC